MVGYNHRLSQRFVEKQISALGNTCTMVEISRSFDEGPYREEKVTRTNHTILKCHVSIMSEADESVKQGEARSGDLFFYFDYGKVSICKQGNEIIFDGQTFQVYDVHNFRAIGNIPYLVECRTRNVQDGTGDNVTTLTEEVIVDAEVTAV
jgi:hypothetical protein